MLKAIFILFQIVLAVSFVVEGMVAFTFHDLRKAGKKKYRKAQNTTVKKKIYSRMQIALAIELLAISSAMTTLFCAITNSLNILG